ncbi:phosphate acetyltransferase [Protaetiibacter mangrovi]|uniref:Phosphate acetyltransferase n=1 Tax=Protaetiibacter mangrovi TaxID=2970926 RepID=A0ABT1ZEI1_9MICO|nr:phosphate acetyltransferase [Protaetiibacter mangrovi]MCS0499107.1 phosphate acetyltransferase [Protaetiibacter mangrovi]TPX05347.1 phosphate acetyltransferase [Schumannella luteola]
MVTRIYLTSAEGRTGKSTVAAGLLETLTASVPRVGVFRPIVRADAERDFILELLVEHASAGQSYEDCVGVDYDALHADPDAALTTIVERFADVEERCDAVLILGSDYTDVGSPTELATNGRIAANLAAPVVLVTGGRQPEGDEPRTPKQCAEIARIALDELHAEHAEVLAAIVNPADPSRVGDIASRVAAATGLPAWAIAEDAELQAPLLRTVLEATDAELVRGDEAALERPVMGTTIAAMSLPNVLPRLIPGGIVVVPGDRSEVLVGTMAAQLSQTFPALTGIILNGGFEIDPAIERLIDGLGTPLPIARTDYSTFETAVRLTQARSRLAADSPAKHARAVSLFAEHVDAAELVRLLSLPTAGGVMTPIRFEHTLVERARAAAKHIVLPEGDDDRILQAAAIVVKRRIATLTILGEPDAVRARAAALGLDLGDSRILSTSDPELHPRFAEEYARLRAHKGVSPELAADTVTDVSYFGTMMVHLGLADGMVSGAKHTTAHTIRPAFEIVKTAPGVSVVSSVFLMALADRVLVYGDCAVIPEPTVEQLADIAVSSAATARQFGIDPRVAMLSYSTGESGSGAEVERVRAATELVRERAPELPVAGPIQYDAAADPTVGASKMPGSEVAGRATVFVFPDLNTGNNTYKAVQRSAGAVAIGPVLQGLAKPINDLSRGALVRDIVNTIAITAIQAEGGE